MRVTPALVSGFIAEFAPGVSKIAGVTPKHVKIASAYLSEEIAKAGRGQYASEFLTSDLMKYLDGADGKARL